MKKIEQLICMLYMIQSYGFNEDSAPYKYLLMELLMSEFMGGNADALLAHFMASREDYFALLEFLDISLPEDYNVSVYLAGLPAIEAVDN